MYNWIALITNRMIHKREVALKFQVTTAIHSKSMKSVKLDYLLAKEKHALKIIIL